MTGKTNSLPMAEVEGKRDMNNHKPYRTREQKELARKSAYKAKDGAWRSTASVSYHKQATNRSE